MIYEPDIEWKAVCDACGEERHSLINWGSAGDFFEHLENEGWSESDGDELCPACSSMKANSATTEHQPSHDDNSEEGR